MRPAFPSGCQTPKESDDFPESGDFEPPKYIASLIAAINEGAKAAQGGVLLYLLVALYLLATVFSTSDEDLLRNRTITIAQIGAALPPSFSFAIAPLVFVFLHVYTLTRFDMLAANLRHFAAELPRMVPVRGQREHCRQLLGECGVRARPRRPARLAAAQFRVALDGLRCCLRASPSWCCSWCRSTRCDTRAIGILWAQRAWIASDVLALLWFFGRNRMGVVPAPPSVPRTTRALGGFSF